MSDSLKCSFCLNDEDDREYLTNDNNNACVCSKCAIMFSQYMMQQLNSETSPAAADFKDKNEIKKLTDDEKSELFADKEDKLNETGAWVDYISNCGGEIAFVQLDVEQDDDGGWCFIAKVVTEQKIELSKDAETAMLDDLETIADNMYDQFEAFGLDPQDRVGLKVLVIADDEQ